MSYIAKKRFGQNFLTNKHIIEKLVGLIQPQADDFIVEIGPGLGALTYPLLEKVNRLHVIEIDREVIPILQAQYPAPEKLILHEIDALKFNFHTLAQGKKIRVVGNLPYNISTPLIFHLMQNIEHIQDMHFMLQKEVANRIIAPPNHNDYSRLSVGVQYFCACYKLLPVPPTAFSPAPKVDSAFIRLVPYAQPPVTAINTQTFLKVVQLAFNQRRKTIQNSLKSLVQPQAWELLKINPSLRAENLRLEDFVNLANFVERKEA